MRTEILRSILFEVEGIRKLLLEPTLTTGTATGQGGCSSTSTQPETVNKHRKPYVISRLVGTINHGVYDTTTQKCVYTDTKEACEQWIADQLDADQLEAEQKTKLPKSIDELADRCFAPLRVPDEAYDAFSAMNCLYILRDAYWQAEDWEPDWTDYKEEKYSIYYVNEVLEIHKSAVVRSFLTLPTLAQAEYFLKHHRALIEQARELL